MPTVRRWLVAALACLSLEMIGTLCLAAGGTTTVAAKGQPVHENPHWPAGVAELLQHPARGDGWNSWFSEWPNDVNHYEFRVKDTEQLNEVIALFAKIQVSKALPAEEDANQAKRQPPAPEIRLCPTSEPAGFGWVSSFDAGNAIPVVFTIGNQHRINQWYQQSIRPAGGQFGVMKFSEVPVAVPPTLTIFVAHPAIDLGKLKIPAENSVSAGYLPQLWHESPLRDSKPRAEATVELQQLTFPTTGKVDPQQIQARLQAIRQFLDEHEANRKKTAEESGSPM